MQYHCVLALMAASLVIGCDKGPSSPAPNDPAAQQSKPAVEAKDSKSETDADVARVTRELEELAAKMEKDGEFMKAVADRNKQIIALLGDEDLKTNTAKIERCKRLIKERDDDKDLVARRLKETETDRARYAELQQQVAGLMDKHRADVIHGK